MKSFLLSLTALSALLAALTVYYRAHVPAMPEGTMEVTARVLTADDSEVHSSALSHIGFQTLTIRVLSGKFKDREVTALNSLNGMVDLETLFKPGDKILAALVLDDTGEITHAKAVDLVRQDSLITLCIVFVAALVIYAGVIGIKAIISFVLTLFIIWEVLVRQILAGHPPLLTTSLALVLLSAIIIFTVAGINRKGITAFAGTISGLLITLLATLYFGEEAGLFGMTQPYVNSLIFAGYFTLDIRQIFYSAIILGASGAAMDIAMDIAAAMDEIREKKPGISRMELTRSGITVGRQVIGTMTTTLLLAYSGGYLTLLMIFRVKDPSFMRMLNLKIVAAEIMRTLVGSTGLVMVAPITAVIGGLIIARATATKP